MRSQNSPGTLSRCRPKKSLIWVLAMSTAMPLVKPITTGRGMNFTAVPMPVTPRTTRMHAGHHRAHEQAVDAVHGDDPGHDDHERAGGSADLSLRSAQRGDQKARDDGAVDAGLRREAGGDGERHGQRQGHQTDGDAGDNVLQKLAQRVFAEADDGLGQPPVIQL